ncbi:MAG TPA: hypothetical protein VH253_11365 [Phycisphaerae bacterium]|nr:hypothetical protein [Phycisphaerae bacterium]
MLNRLKTLPLTIVLTVLIWMYAEAQFTNTQENVQLSVRLVTPSPDLAVRAVDPSKTRLSDTINTVVTLQGPRAQLDSIFQQSQGVPDPDLASLSYTPPERELKPGEETSVDVVSMLNSLAYFKTRRVIVSSAAPRRVALEVDRVLHLQKAPDFRPAASVERAVLSDDTVTLNVPATTLEQLGGPGKIAVVAEPQKSLASLKPGTDTTIPVKYVAEYAGAPDDRITVTPPAGTVKVRIPVTQAATEVVPDVPIWASGPPPVLAKYDVDVRPKFVRVTVAGTPAAIAAFHDSRSGAGAAAGVGLGTALRGYVDLSPDDRPADTYTRRRVRYVLPEGLTLQDAPPDVEFRLTEKAPPAPPSTQGGVNR